MRRDYYTVRRLYTDLEYKERDDSVWTFQSKALAIALVNFLESALENDEDLGSLYIEDWSIGADE